MKTTASAANVPAVRILKIATCPSLSGKSKLTYHVGCNDEAEILFRVYANSSTGQFSKEWIVLNAIQILLGKAPKDGTMTSFALMPLFKGQSINTPPFLFAALLNEKLVQPSTTTKRCYETTDGKAFDAQVKTLIASKVDLTDKVQKVETKASQNQLANKQVLKETQLQENESKRRAAKIAKTKTTAAKPATAPAKKAPAKAGHK